MLAYLFWHAAPEGAVVAQYEETVVRFGSALAEARIPGFLGNASDAISGTPWMPETGCEDWAWLEGSWALDGLNERAAAGQRLAAPDGARPVDRVRAGRRTRDNARAAARLARRCRRAPQARSGMRLKVLSDLLPPAVGIA